MQQASQNKLYDIFISHSSKDHKLAIALCHYMETRGLRCWMAPRDIQGGTEYGDAIIKAIKASKIMVVVFTASSNISKAVKHEVERAFHHQLIIIPFRTQNIIPEQSFEFFLSATHWLDAIEGNAEDYFEALYVNCTSLLNVERQHMATASTLVTPRKRKQIITYILAISAVAIISLIAYMVIVHQSQKSSGENLKKDSANIKSSSSNLTKGVPQVTAPTGIPATAIKEPVVHEKMPAEMESALNGVTYDLSTGTDKLLFTVMGAGKVHFSGSIGGYDDVSGTMALIHGNVFKVISGNVSGNIILNEGNQIKGSLIIKSSGMSCTLNLKRVSE
jgi:hypothetical protein